jgi:hypothetical protein
VVALQQQLGAKVCPTATPGNSLQPSAGKSWAFFFFFPATTFTPLSVCNLRNNCFFVIGYSPSPCRVQNRTHVTRFYHICRQCYTKSFFTLLKPLPLFLDFDITRV